MRALFVLAALLAISPPVRAQSEPEELSLTAFVGDWSRHGVVLSVADDGSATALWRIYEWCGPGVTQPCDRLEGNRLIAGGRAELVFTPAAPDAAMGEVVASNDHQLFEPGPVALRLVPYGMAILEQAGQQIVLCGPRYLDEAPPPVVASAPCGA
jgi:hypothetical protein